MKTRLIISYELEFDTEEDCVLEAKEEILREIPNVRCTGEPYTIKVALTRDGDRSGGNLLLPRLDGRFGLHLQGRKAKLSEIINN